MAGSAPHIPGCRDLSLIGERVARSLFSGFSDRLARPVTVTVFPPLADGRARQAFDAAATTARRLGAHPSVLTIHEWGQAPDGRPWVVSEPQPAESADALLALDGPLEAERALQVGILLAGALETAHRAGIVHGDLQPDRLVFGHQGEPLLVEIGLAQFAVFPGLGALNNPVRYHAPPEVLERTEITPATDVYSLATTVYALLAGRAPHQKPAEVTDSNASLLLRILQMPVPPIDRPDLPPGLDDALRGPLSASPDKRPQKAIEVAWLLQDVQRRAGLPLTEPVVLDLDDLDDLDARRPAGTGAAPQRDAGPAPTDSSWPLPSPGVAAGAPLSGAEPGAGDEALRSPWAPAEETPAGSPWSPAGEALPSPWAPADEALPRTPAEEAPADEALPSPSAPAGEALPSPWAPAGEALADSPWGGLAAEPGGLWSAPDDARAAASPWATPQTPPEPPWSVPAAGAAPWGGSGPAPPAPTGDAEAAPGGPWPAPADGAHQPTPPWPGTATGWPSPADDPGSGPAAHPDTAPATPAEDAAAPWPPTPPAGDPAPPWPPAPPTDHDNGATNPTDHAAPPWPPAPPTGHDNGATNPTDTWPASPPTEDAATLWPSTWPDSGDGAPDLPAWAVQPVTDDEIGHRPADAGPGAWAAGGDGGSIADPSLPGSPGEPGSQLFGSEPFGSPSTPRPPELDQLPAWYTDPLPNAGPQVNGNGTHALPTGPSTRGPGDGGDPGAGPAPLGGSPDSGTGGGGGGTPGPAGNPPAGAGPQPHRLPGAGDELRSLFGEIVGDPDPTAGNHAAVRPTAFGDSPARPPELPPPVDADRIDRAFGPAPPRPPAPSSAAAPAPERPPLPRRHAPPAWPSPGPQPAAPAAPAPERPPLPRRHAPPAWPSPGPQPEAPAGLPRAPEPDEAPTPTPRPAPRQVAGGDAPRGGPATPQAGGVDGPPALPVVILIVVVVVLALGVAWLVVTGDGGGEPAANRDTPADERSADAAPSDVIVTERPDGVEITWSGADDTEYIVTVLSPDAAPEPLPPTRGTSALVPAVGGAGAGGRCFTVAVAGEQEAAGAASDPVCTTGASIDQMRQE